MDGLIPYLPLVYLSRSKYTGENKKEEVCVNDVLYIGSKESSSCKSLKVFHYDLVSVIKKIITDKTFGKCCFITKGSQHA